MVLLKNMTDQTGLKEFEVACINGLSFSLTHHKESKLLLMVSDNGIGIPESLNIESSNSLGLKIVSGLVSQIHGDLIPPRVPLRRDKRKRG